LQSYYSRISALVTTGHCTSRFKRAMRIPCRPHGGVHKGVRLMWTHVDGAGCQKPDFLVDVTIGWPHTILDNKTDTISVA